MRVDLDQLDTTQRQSVAALEEHFAVDIAHSILAKHLQLGNIPTLLNAAWLLPEWFLALGAEGKGLLSKKEDRSAFTAILSGVEVLDSDAIKDLEAIIIAKAEDDSIAQKLLNIIRPLPYAQRLAVLASFMEREAP